MDKINFYREQYKLTAPEFKFHIHEKKLREIVQQAIDECKS
jgi:hypothetical protein